MYIEINGAALNVKKSAYIIHYYEKSRRTAKINEINKNKVNAQEFQTYKHHYESIKKKCNKNKKI